MDRSSYSPVGAPDAEHKTLLNGIPRTEACGGKRVSIIVVIGFLVAAVVGITVAVILNSEVSEPDPVEYALLPPFNMKR